MILEKGFTALTARQARPFLETAEEAIRKERIVIRGKEVSPFAGIRASSLMKSWENGTSAMAFNANDEVIGHAMLACVGGADPRHPWFELRAAWVHPEYRGVFPRKPAPKMEASTLVGYRLYRRLLDEHPEKKIFETSVTKAAWVVGHRLGMKAIRFPLLPHDVWTRTCATCPTERTGVHPSNNAPDCTIREHGCSLRVTHETWEKMGCPPTDPGIDEYAPTTELVIPDDDVRIVLSRRAS